jgi:transglutaminase-like putative cysteine protease
VTILRPIPPTVARPVSALLLLAWAVQMGFLIHRSARRTTVLAADVGRYGSGAQWKGVYYKGRKIGFTVSETVEKDGGYELKEDGQLQMTLLGAATAAHMKTVARVDSSFALRSFTFSLDPGTGPLTIDGSLDGRRLDLTISSASGKRSESRVLEEPPALSLSLPRRLVAAGMKPGLEMTVEAFDPATLRNAPMTVRVESRDVVWVMRRPVPAFKVRTDFAGITATSWVTEVGEVVKEESPTGLLVVRETPDRAAALAVPGDVQDDLIAAAAVVPHPGRRIDDASTVDLLRVRLDGVDLANPDLEGVGQHVSGQEIEIRSQGEAAAGPADPAAPRYSAPEAFIESDAPEILAEAKKAVGALTAPRDRAERLVRHVNAILDKKPTVSLPSALEVLRTRVGDCNEHTVLYVAMARALGIPARIAVGLVHVDGAFYYHAWAEVYVEGPPGRGLWLRADPSLNQFPADATHIRLARGGLDRQAILMQMIGRLKMRMLDLQLRPGAVPVLVGRSARDLRPLELALPHRDGSGPTCWSRPR